jgi:glycosyltransferase involved in cell wall biosynthesis
MVIHFRTPCISPHLNSFISALHKLQGNVKFVYTTSDQGRSRRAVGWNNETDYPAFLDSPTLRSEAEDAEVVVDMLKDIALMEKRIKKGLRTFYCGERWFKPRLGLLRLLWPAYFLTARRFVKLLHHPSFSVLPMGIHAARDLLRLNGLLNGDLQCLFLTPKVAFESRPGGCVVPLKTVLDANVLSTEEVKFSAKYGFIQIPKSCWGRFKGQGIYSKIRIWGYFVDSSDRVAETSLAKIQHTTIGQQHGTISVLWAGRMLWWKRTMDLIKVARENKNIFVDIYGEGPQAGRLKRAVFARVRVAGFISNHELRAKMRSYDVFVLPSNSCEGWGAVISEVLVEGGRVLASLDAGASATMLPISNLYKAGDVSVLSRKLNLPVNNVEIGEWTGRYASEAFTKMI